MNIITSTIKRGIDFSRSTLTNFQGKGDFSNSIFDGLSPGTGFYFSDYCNLNGCSFKNVAFGQESRHFASSKTITLRGADFTGATPDTAWTTKADFIAYFGAENLDEKTLWIDGTPVLEQ